MSRRLFAHALVLVVAGVVVVMVFRSFTDSLLFYPERGQWRTPAALDLPFEEVWLDAGAYRIQSWWVAGDTDRQAPVVVMFHGNGGTIADRLDNVASLVERFGVTVFQVEYPGYGDSGGRPSEESLYTAGELALAEARGRAPGRKLIVFGRSLGGAVAIELASRAPIDGLVAESSFTSLPDMAAASGIPLARHLVSYAFDSLSKIERVRAPILLVHGDRDEIVPYSMAGRLLEATARARLHTVAGGAHNDTWLVGGEGYWLAWARFLDELGGGRSLAGTIEDGEAGATGDSPEP